MSYLQDIHLEDIDLWKSFTEYWSNGQYSAALSYLQENQYQLNTKYLKAEFLNNLTDKIVELENKKSDPFKTDKIVVSSTVPSGMISGQVYFQLN